MKPRIELIIMTIFMKIVKICAKSPWFTVHVKTSKKQTNACDGCQLLLLLR